MVYTVASVKEANFVSTEGTVNVVPAGSIFLATSEDLNPFNEDGTHFAIKAGKVTPGNGIVNADDLIVEII